VKTTRYQLVQRAGIWLDRWTAQLWDKLVAKFPGLILTQGVRSGAPASGGTHLGLGVLDLYLGRWAGKWREVLRYAFDIGFFGWYRPELWVWRAGKKVREWKTHMHLGVRGCVKAAASLKAQFTSWLRVRNGLQGDGRDAFTYRPKNASKAAPYTEPKPPKPPKPPREAKPWFNVSFLNTWGNSVEGGRDFDDRVPALVETSTAGSPAIAAFSEVRSSQRRILREAMTAADYLPVAYERRNMLDVYRRHGVTSVAFSFSPFTKQHGGNIEGVLRVKFKADGSRAQVGVVHLDHDSPESYKRHNLKEAYNALRRYGARMGIGWKKRTVIVGDFNDDDVAAKVLGPLGFKQLQTGSAPIDQAWTGADRDDRGGAATKTKSDHRRILARLGRR
jgi:hypothetical protein